MSQTELQFQIVTLKTPVRYAGLSLRASDLPNSFESLGLLWDRFHKQVLPGLQSQVQPPVEAAACVEGDYLVGGQITGEPGLSELTEFIAPAGTYLKVVFSAKDFSQLVDEVLPNLWPQVKDWAKEQDIAFDNGRLFALEVYPQATVSLPRPSMYCLYPIQSN